MGWVGLGPFLRSNPVIFGTMATSSVAVAVAMYFILEQWREAAEVKPPEPKTQYITQDTEDALTLNTLSTLLGHYNPAIRDTAARIVIDRALNDGSTLELLLWGITRPDYDERIKHLRALNLIMDSRKTPITPGHALLLLLLPVLTSAQNISKCSIIGKRIPH
jgi:hypothetical protein